MFFSVATLHNVLLCGTFHPVFLTVVIEDFAENF